MLDNRRSRIVFKIKCFFFFSGIFMLLLPMAWPYIGMSGFYRKITISDIIIYDDGKYNGMNFMASFSSLNNGWIEYFARKAYNADCGGIRYDNIEVNLHRNGQDNPDYISASSAIKNNIGNILLDGNVFSCSGLNGGDCAIKINSNSATAEISEGEINVRYTGKVKAVFSQQ